MYTNSLFITSATTNSIWHTLQECGIYGAELILDMERQMCEMGFYNHDVPGGGILHIEQTLLDLGSNPEVTSGMFYLLPVYADNKLFLR